MEPLPSGKGQGEHKPGSDVKGKVTSDKDSAITSPQQFPLTVVTADYEFTPKGQEEYRP